MSIDKNAEVKFFGFRIGKTGTIILSFIALTLFIQYIPHVYYMGQMLLLYIFNTPITEILANIGSFIQGLISFIIPLTLLSFLLVLFILCATMQKSFRSEDIYVKWFSYRLTKSSITVLFILSLIFIIIDSMNFFDWVISFTYMILHMPISFVIYYIIIIVTVLLSMIIQVYTLIICVKSREILF
ncbi:MAG: hypothetical protein ACFFA7_08725 [Promethearchaeota archaeon]